MSPFSYVQAKSLPEAVKQLSSQGAVLHAGGTDLLGCLRDHVLEASTLVSVSQVKELRGVSRMNERGLRIGALTRIAEIAGDPTIQKHYRALKIGRASCRARV